MFGRGWGYFPPDPWDMPFYGGFDDYGSHYGRMAAVSDRAMDVRDRVGHVSRPVSMGTDIGARSVG